MLPFREPSSSLSPSSSASSPSPNVGQDPNSQGTTTTYRAIHFVENVSYKDQKQGERTRIRAHAMKDFTWKKQKKTKGLRTTARFEWLRRARESKEVGQGEVHDSHSQQTSS